MSNLVLTLRVNESVDVAGPCRVTFLGWFKNAGRFAIEADRDVEILRVNAVKRTAPPPASGRPTGAAAIRSHTQDLQA